uniref:Aminotransferase-like plant mobile domain-containing protein n=1 Tax=Fagus sylvatica TaxID=28930 RepID=A0A2N9IXH4_FAGSY
METSSLQVAFVVSFLAWTLEISSRDASIKFLLNVSILRRFLSSFILRHFCRVLFETLLSSFILRHFCRAVRSFMSQGNPTKVLKWWGRLNFMTHSFIETAGFKYFVETQPTKTAKKSLLCALAERCLRIYGIVPTFNAFPARVHPDREHLGISLGETSADLPALMRAFAEAPQTTIEETTCMARAFLLYLIGTTLDCNTSQTVLVRWLHLLVDFQQTVQYNWGGVALANLYAGFDFYLSGGHYFFCRSLEDLAGVDKVDFLVVDKKVYSWAQFSHLFEGPGFTLFPYEAPNEVILLWRMGISMLDRLDEDGDFEKLMAVYARRQSLGIPMSWGILSLRTLMLIAFLGHRGADEVLRLTGGCCLIVMRMVVLLQLREDIFYAHA